MSNMRPVDAPAPLLSFLFATWPETKKKQVREWLKFGSVAVNDRIVTQFDHPLKRGDQVTIHRRGMAAPETKLQGGIRIRHEDADIIVIEKPAGLLSIASASEEDKTAYAMLTKHVRRGNARGRERVWIVHRLDRETSGVMVFAKTEAAKTALQKSWDDAEKKYFAVVEGAPPQESGTLEAWLDESNPLKVYDAPRHHALSRDEEGQGHHAARRHARDGTPPPDPRAACRCGLPDRRRQEVRCGDGSDQAHRAPRVLAALHASGDAQADAV
jgi:23S rRNA pseudouridine1911/1915/1917 synthase